MAPLLLAVMLAGGPTLSRPSRPAKTPSVVDGSILTHQLLLLDAHGSGALTAFDDVKAFFGTAAVGAPDSPQDFVRHVALRPNMALRGYTLAWELYALRGDFKKLAPLFPDTAGILLVVDDPSTAPSQIATLKGLVEKHDAVLGHDVCLVLYTPHDAGNLATLGYPVLTGALDGRTLVKSLMKDVLYGTSGRGCGVSGPTK